MKSKIYMLDFSVLGLRAVNGIIIFLVFVLASVCAMAQQYQVIPVSGFNQDLIAEGVGTAGSHRAQATTTTTLDSPSTSGACNVMYAKNFRGDNNLTTAPTYGLVDNGFIVSVSDNNKRYQLANFTGNNALLLVSLNASGTLTFATSGCYSALSILATSGQSSSSFDVTVNFSDGTTASYTFSVPDWYGGSNYAIQGMGRVTRTNDGGNGYDTFSGDASNPRLYDCNMSISGGNVNKLVQSITVTKNESGVGRTAILALCGKINSTVPGTPVATSATSVLSTSYTANWNAVDNATGYYLDVSTVPTFSSFVTGYNNLSVGNVVSKSVTGLTSGTQYFYRVRAANGNGQSFNSNTISVGGLLAPVATDATSKTSTSFSANWGSVAGATGYYLDVATDFYFQSLVSSNQSTGNVTTYSVTGLTSGVTYYYRVRAANASYTSLSSNIVSTGLPVPPVVTYALNVGVSSFTANWSPVTATSYRIDVSTSSSFGTFVTGYNNLNIGNVSSYNITGLSSNTTYYYRIRSVNANGTSENSNTVTVTTKNFGATISPGNSTICYEDSPGTYTATGGGGTGTYTYLWYKNGTSTGSTNQTYNPGSLTSNTTIYCDVSSTGYGTVSTSTVTVTVYPNVTISISGGTSPICTSTAPGTFTATAAGGNGIYTYEWFKNSVTTGVTNSTYTPGALTATSAIYCETTSAGCEADASNTITITVNPATSLSSQSTATQTACLNWAFNPISVTAGGTSLTYQWYMNTLNSVSGGTSLLAANGATTNTYTPQATSAGTLYYYCIIHGTCGSDVTSSVSGAFTVNSPSYSPTPPTVASLLATGTNIKWYSASTGGSPLATSATVVNGNHYYASQTVNGVESTSRLDVVAAVDQTPCKPTGTASQTYSAGTTIASLQATGSNIRWYSASSGGTPLSASTVLTNGAHYYATQTINCTESATRFDVTITIN